MIYEIHNVCVLNIFVLIQLQLNREINFLVLKERRILQKA